MCRNRGGRCVDYGSLSLSGTACQLIFCVLQVISQSITHTHTHPRSVQHVQRAVLQNYLANPCVLHGGIGWSLGLLFCSLLLGMSRHNNSNSTGVRVIRYLSIRFYYATLSLQSFSLQILHSIPFTAHSMCQIYSSGGSLLVAWQEKVVRIFSH